MRSRLANSQLSAQKQDVQNTKQGVSNPLRSMTASLEFQRNGLLAVCAFLIFVIVAGYYQAGIKRDAIQGSEQCLVSFGPYKGSQYYSPESGTVGSPTCLVESKWLKLSQHSVKFPDSQTTFDDWLWIDYHDRINVLVEDETRAGEERRFLVFEQTKYALEGRSSMAIIGGIIEPGEDPESAARREVDEEMNGLQCQNFHALGRYRTDVNRGMGWVNGFLATKCSRDPNRSKHQALVDEVGAADTERQNLKSISLPQLREAARNGEFLEVQWTATVALALLHQELME